MKSKALFFSLLKSIPFLLFLMAMIQGSLSAQTGTSKPNFIVILMDDMGYGDVSSFGSKTNPTPQIDQLAKEGMKMTSFYAAPLCTASRTQLLTGCYNKRVSMPDVLFSGSKVGLNAAEKTIPSLLKPLGYSTMAIGKWHLGDQSVYLPLSHGFDHYFGIPYSNNMDGDGKPDKKGKIIPPLPLIVDKKIVEAPVKGESLTRRFTEEGIKFIKNNQDKPFFLYFCHTAVHHPLQPGPEFLGKSGKGEFHDWMAEVDWSVGQIMATVRELGLDKNTMVIFTSDNGSVCKEGGSNAPLRGAKFTTWEGGVRVPAIFWWPEKILPGVTTDAVLSELDILPTVVKLAGGSAPADRKIDGFDIWPLLSGKTNQSPREALYFWLWGTLQGVRSGSWKLVIADQKQGVSNEEGNQEGGGDSSEGDKKKKKTKGEGKSDLVEASIEKPRLYNLDLDPGEKSDVADQHPEVISKMMEYVKIMEGDLGVEKSSKKGPAAPGIRRYEPLSTSKVLSGVGDDYK